MTSVLTQSVPKSSLSLFIRNTFIDVEEEKALDPRRASSEPPSCRHADRACESSITWFDRGCSLDLSESTASGPESPRCSTSDGLSDDDTETISMSPLPSSKLNPNAAEWSPSQVPSMPLPPAEFVPPPPQPLQARPARKGGALTAPELNPTLIPRFFQRQFCDIMQAVKTALSKDPFVNDVELGEGEGQWGKGLLVRGRMSSKQESYDAKEADLLLAAQKALLQSADESKSIYVIGYHLMPFTATENGFSAMLGGVGVYFGQTKYEEGYCWDMITKGFCGAQGVCCREHPAAMVPIYVDIKKIEESGRWSDLD